jgi:hypothetical protein
MASFTREQLAAYLDDSLNDAETARIEQALRQSESLRMQIRAIMQERDRGEHSLGAVWRRERLTCPAREQLSSFLLGALDPGWRDYIDFHLHTIACAFCLANLEDLKTRQEEPAPQITRRRRRIFDSSAGFLKAR